MLVKFGDFVLDRGTRQLRRGEEERRLGPKAFELLELLLNQRPNVVTRERIRDRVWPGTFVSESTLSTVVAEVRAALDEEREAAPIPAHGPWRRLRVLWPGHRVGAAGPRRPDRLPAGPRGSRGRPPPGRKRAGAGGGRRGLAGVAQRLASPRADPGRRTARWSSRTSPARTARSCAASGSPRRPVSPTATCSASGASSLKLRAGQADRSTRTEQE